MYSWRFERRSTPAITPPGRTFHFPATSTVQFATPLATSAPSSTYAPPFKQVSTLLDPNITYTTYSLDRAATKTQDGQYGQSAYASLWANYTYSVQPPFTTTVTPAPVSRGELALPPPLPLVPADANTTMNLKFPSDFILGVASSAWQIEGGLQLAGRGPSVEDVIGALPSNSNDSNVSAMFYYLYKQDILRLAEIGIPYLCFSIPWTRVVPFGVAGSPVNTEALDHYDDLINTALAHGITPIVTIVHYDIPVSVPYSDENFSNHYLYYAKQVMTRYGDRVPYWVTFNEPNLQPVNNALTNILVAHASLYDWYKKMLKGKGKITMKFANNLPIPLNSSSRADIAAALRYQDFSLGVMNNPLFLGKQIPESVLNTSKIPITALTNAQLSLIHGKVDFFSFDPYSAQFVTSPPGGVDACAADPSNPLWPTCVVLTNVAADGWLIGQASSVTYSFIDPQFVRSQLSYVWNTFRPSGVLIAEFGFPSYGDEAQILDVQRYDLLRTNYYQAYMTEVLKSIHLDEVNVIGTLSWCFLETNEFGTYDDHYGLQTVNRTSFDRTYKRSAFDYVEFFHQHS
ncbi:glycoside hydrolase family 1 protein [Sphaerobolus stellatus SS14]|uniref:Glycoside hydrolase family 1 protein n=1 Tax=Sphaerobolus stellatus (strain SS14) TaxID=990650 RepID=A0A0C9VEB9_SPHS4|nr:glycoside hydrolase family 1 protein [Sphaerobolus stellatus SS14]